MQSNDRRVAPWPRIGPMTAIADDMPHIAGGRTAVHGAKRPHERPSGSQRLTADPRPSSIDGKRPEGPDHLRITYQQTADDSAVRRIKPPTKTPPPHPPHSQLPRSNSTPRPHPRGPVSANEPIPSRSIHDRNSTTSSSPDFPSGT